MSRNDKTWDTGVETTRRWILLFVLASELNLLVPDKKKKAFFFIIVCIRFKLLISRDLKTLLKEDLRQKKQTSYWFKA
jgi:hypothetical protein